MIKINWEAVALRQWGSYISGMGAGMASVGVAAPTPALWIGLGTVFFFGGYLIKNKEDHAIKNQPKD